MLYKQKHIYGSSRVGMDVAEKNMISTSVTVQSFYRESGKKQYELSNHLGNVLTVITDKKLPVESTTTTGTVDYFVVEILTASDYSPFGVLLQNRNFTGVGYRYGYGSHEKIDEVSGSGNTVDMGDRWLDVRLGRTPKMDAKAHLYPGISPYAYALNTPIWAYDPDGRIVVFANKKSERQFNRLYKAADSETKARLDVLKSSEVIYNVNTQASLSGRQGSSQYNFNTGQFDVLVDKNSSNQIGSLGDELTHAHQFETGDLGYIQHNNGQVGTLGYDMEDEVASKRGEISATQAVNSAEGINLPLDNTTQAFQKADTDPVPDGMTRNQMIENYFNTDPSAQQYLQILDPRGKKMGVNIPGSGGYTEGQLKGAVQSGQFKDFIYREKQPDGSTKTIQGSGN